MFDKGLCDGYWMIGFMKKITGGNLNGMKECKQTKVYDLIYDSKDRCFKATTKKSYETTSSDFNSKVCSFE